MNGRTTRYLVDTNRLTGYAQVVEELDGGNNVQRVYVYGDHLVSQDQVINAIWTQSFFGYDGQGSVRFPTDSTGTLTDKYDYDGFGNLINSTGTTPNNFLFSAEQFDSDLGFYYLRARYMNSAVGRFLTMDDYEGEIQDPLSLHKYLYCTNDAVNKSDPSGYDGDLQTTTNNTGIIGNLNAQFSSFLTTHYSALRAAFGAGGAAIGKYWNQIGAFAQDAGRKILDQIPNANVVENTRKGIDFVVSVGNRFAQIEAKWSLTLKSSEALERLVGQVWEAYYTGRGQVVVWSLREPTIQQLRRVTLAIGSIASEVQFVHGIDGLWNWAKFYFGF